LTINVLLLVNINICIIFIIL